MITVMGATGNTGTKITEGLLRAGERVRALGRDERRLATLGRAGADTMVGDARDATFLAHAFRGARAVYVLVAADPRADDYRADQDRHGEAIMEAVRRSKVRHVVALSSLGAERSKGTGIITGLHVQEERMKGLEDIHLLFLRPAPFFENFRDALALGEQMGFIADVVLPDLAVPMVATRDIAAVAERALRAADWNGPVVQELLGPRDMSFAQATGILGERIDRPGLQYVQLGYDEMAETLSQAGLSTSFARLYVEMHRAFNESKVRPLAGRMPENTTPTSFEGFVDDLIHDSPDPLRLAEIHDGSPERSGGVGPV